MSSIDVYCTTTIDKYKQESWPAMLPCKPVIGETMMSASGVVLKICGITYSKGQVVYIELTRL